MGIRLVYFGGSREFDLNGKARSRGISDNSAFQIAANNVIKSYMGKKDKVIIKKIDTARHIVNDIEQQLEGSIVSLDILSHGSPLSLNFSKKPYQACGFYVGWIGKKAICSYYSDDDGDYKFTADARSISDINYKKFDKSARIQLHGCLTASDWFRSPNGKKLFPIIVDNVATQLSQELYSAGKKDAIVIGHSTRGNPLINGKGTKIREQDYRHGERIIYHSDGKSKSTTKTGYLTDDFINKFITK